MSPSNDDSRTWTMFLDFDGVLNNEPFVRHQRNHSSPGQQQHFDPENMAALNRLCADLPVSSIVVSSSWRADRDLDELRLMLSQAGFNAPGLVDATTDEAADDAAGRAEAIAAYVKEMELEVWFALDDYNLDPYLDVRVPQVHGAQGLTAELVTEIVSVLHDAPMPQGASKLERTACEHLRAYLQEEESEAILGTSSNEGALLTSLEWYLSDLLADSSWAQDETTDGLVGHFCERVGPRGIRIVGALDLMGGHTYRTVPFMIEVEANEAFDRFERALGCIDEADLSRDGRSLWPDGFNWSKWQLRYKSQRINWLHRIEI